MHFENDLAMSRGRDSLFFLAISQARPTRSGPPHVRPTEGSNTQPGSDPSSCGMRQRAPAAETRPKSHNLLWSGTSPDLAIEGERLV